MIEKPLTDSINFIYILSQRYSGSTLLSFLMGTHPDIATIGERRKFYNKSIKNADFRHHKARHCSCGELFENCKFFNEVKQQVLQKISPDDLSTNTTEFNIYNHKYLNRFAYEIIKFCKLHSIDLKWTPFNRKVKSLCDFNRILAREILKIEQSKAFLDTSKSIDQALYLSMMNDVDFKVVWLIRDPRAQINSALKYNKWTIDYAARHWMREMDENEKILNGLELQFTRLRYEDLCRNADKELTKVFRFVELDPTAFSLDFREAQQHIIGNAKMRLGKDKTIVERTEWKHELSSSQIKRIEQLTDRFRHLYTN